VKQSIQIGARAEFSSTELWDMYRLRARIFNERMGWEVSMLSGMEVDGYDALDPYYMLIRGASGHVLGCWRLLPTEGPYMLKDTFPQLLHGKAAPQAGETWELSRFAIDTAGPQGFGFTGLALEAMRQVVAFGHSMGIKNYVTVTTTPVERLLKKAGIAMHRFGPPMRIGVENAVALDIDIGEQTRKALFDTPALAA
jgi:acyl homoserine lactone synthase